MPAARLTHFLCLPLITKHSKPQLQLSLQRFATTAMEKYEVPPKAIRPMGTIHLTLGVMQLTTEEQVEAASNFLRSLDLPQMLKSVPQREFVHPNITEPSDNSSTNHVSSNTGAKPSVKEAAISEAAGSDESPPPLKVSMSGLESMHTPSKTSILYTSPKDSTSRLYAFASSLRDAFLSVDLLVPEKRPLLLHATIVNTLYAKTKGRAKGTGHGKDNHGIGKFDATFLLEEFQDFEWASDFCVERVSICQMGAKKEIVDGVLVNEEYVEVASVPLP
ncbi:MAG: hypothetical protein Q9195_003836 [Heterodermia aff. obscurata]